MPRVCQRPSRVTCGQLLFSSPCVRRTGLLPSLSMRQICQAPERFEWKQPPYEYVHNLLPFDVIAGTAKLREQIVAQTPLDEIASGWRADEDAFRKLREKYLLY